MVYVFEWSDFFIHPNSFSHRLHRCDYIEDYSWFVSGWYIYFDRFIHNVLLFVLFWGVDLITKLNFLLCLYTQTLMYLLLRFTRPLGEVQHISIS